MKIWSKLIAVGVFINAATAVFGADTNNSVKIGIQSSGAFFKGLPMIVALEVRNEGEHGVDYPALNPLDSWLPIILHFQGTNGMEYSSSVNRYGFILDEVDTDTGTRVIPKIREQLLSGECGRFLVNLGPTIERLNPRIGKYSMTLQLLQSGKNSLAKSLPLDITISEYPLKELASITNRARLNIYGAADMKGRLTVKNIESLKPQDLREIVGLTSLLHEIAMAEDISALNINDYRGLVSGSFLPEVDQIEYEILMAKNEKDKANEVKTRLLQQTPAMIFWIDRAARNQGLCLKIKGR